eukprot:TRINITY_DN13926_c1_g1_i1.p3 TRINITY_DN13926_c1_g1~~TRINITY_DN13926_c1_g1_i1.p3  ORF type:complete len:151 (+),score=0.25 TRINITY_DN13926_c1_g1_i1:579-1031(+)
MDVKKFKVIIRLVGASLQLLCKSIDDSEVPIVIIRIASILVWVFTTQSPRNLFFGCKNCQTFGCVLLLGNEFWCIDIYVYAFNACVSVWVEKVGSVWWVVRQLEVLVVFKQQMVVFKSYLLMLIFTKGLTLKVIEFKMVAPLRVDVNGWE